MLRLAMGQLKTFIITLVFFGQSCSGADEQFEKIVKSPEKFHDQ